MIVWSSASAQKNLSLKFNFGSSFSSPRADLAIATRKGKEMQLFATAELAQHISYSKKTGMGIKLAAVAGYDYANFLNQNGLTELKVNIPNLRLRVYPLSYSGTTDQALEKMRFDKLPFGIDYAAMLLVFSSLNSLHFDYGVGFGDILETAYVDGVNFPDQTTKRTMRNFSWGFQPNLYQSESGNFLVNAIFDFGKYSWKNGNNGTSAIKSNHLGFGFQFRFNGKKK
jgi:hypothetical protein